jgi:hypothetical protein
MKKTINYLALFLIILLAFVACKKKEKTTTNTTSTSTTTGTAPHANSMTATINNKNWAMLTNSQGYSAYSISKFANIYSFNGQTNFKSPYTSVQLSFTYTTGLINLTPSGIFSAHYTDSNNISYTARAGTVNIITLDTMSAGQSIINKFKANFSFVTDTISNKSYTITNGVVDYIKQ